MLNLFFKCTWLRTDKVHLLLNITVYLSAGFEAGGDSPHGSEYGIVTSPTREADLCNDRVFACGEGKVIGYLSSLLYQSPCPEVLAAMAQVSSQSERKKM